MFRPDLDVTSAYVGFTGCGVSSGGGEGLVGLSLEASEDGSGGTLGVRVGGLPLRGGSATCGGCDSSR